MTWLARIVDWLPSRPNVSARTLRRFHGWATVAWAVMLPVSATTGLRGSVPYLVAISVYALMVGHFSSWQSTRAEEAATGGEE